MSGNGAETAIAMERLTDRPPAWTTELGPSSETILSSRVRLARNLNSIPFPAQTTPDQQKQVIGRMRRAVEQVDALDTASFIGFESLEKTDLDFLVERRLVSRDLVKGSRARGVLVGEGEETTIMVNEEDHYRLQSVLSGLRLGEALDRLNNIDDVLDAGLDYAFDAELGYLTACPTNVGTGMRASVLAHLPGLVLTRRAKKVVQGVSAMGMAVRGFYGEGTEIMGNFFQISNQTTLGKGENEIVTRLDEVVRQILGYEAEARDTMLAQARVQLEDKIYRAYGALSSARTITADEVVSLASAVRFGISMEMGGLCTLPVLNEILLFSQPGHVSRMAGLVLESDERHRLRADMIRAALDTSGGEPTGGAGGNLTEGPSASPEG
jgi:protein arginine kinase